MTNLRIVIAVLRDGQIRRVAIGLLAFSMAESATWLAITVYAYSRGGVGEAGVLQFIQLAPAAAIVPFLSSIGDRFPRHRVLAGGFAAQAITMTVCGAAIAAEVAAPVVYLLSTCVAITVTFSRPTGAAVLPSLVDSPEGLTATNVIDAFGRELGIFIGPAAAGLVLMRNSPGFVFLGGGALMALMVLITARLRPVSVIADDMHEPWSAHVIGGLRLLRSDRDSRLLVILLTLGWAVFGALDVAYVVVAVELVGRGEGTAGLLTAVLGVGGMLGSIASLAMVSRRRLTVPLALGALFGGGAFAAVSGGSSIAVVIPLFIAIGIGFTVMDVAGRTMLQGLAPDDTLARLFGVLEGLSMGALALGALWFAGMAGLFGVKGALIATGLLVPVAIAMWFARLTAIDRARPVVDPELLSFVRGVSISRRCLRMWSSSCSSTWCRAATNLVRRSLPRGRRATSSTWSPKEAPRSRCRVGCGSKLCQGSTSARSLWFVMCLEPRVCGAAPKGWKCTLLDRDVFLPAVTGSDRSMYRLSTTVDSRLSVIDEHRR